MVEITPALSLPLWATHYKKSGFTHYKKSGSAIPQQHLYINNVNVCKTTYGVVITSIGDVTCYLRECHLNYIDSPTFAQKLGRNVNDARDAG